jgi:L-ascorbate metabolism protein UlaG (beta-lactamase superfamily)
VGGVTTIDAIKAKKIIDEIHPGAVFPMHYGDIRFYKLAGVKDFTKLFPPDQLKNTDGNHLRIKKSELTDKPVIYTLHVPIQNN